MILDCKNSFNCIYRGILQVYYSVVAPLLFLHLSMRRLFYYLSLIVDAEISGDFISFIVRSPKFVLLQSFLFIKYCNVVVCRYRFFVFLYVTQILSDDTTMSSSSPYYIPYSLDFSKVWIKFA